MNAIEYAAHAALETVMHDGDSLRDWLDNVDGSPIENAIQFIRPAIAAFLRNCELILDDRIFDTSNVTPQELKTMFDNIAKELERN